MRNLFFKLLKFTGLPFFFREIKQRNNVTILLFHDIDSKTAEKTFYYLSKKYNLISLDLYLQAMKSQDFSKIPPYAMIITFDDGLKGNYNILPQFKKYKVPATIFLCSDGAVTEGDIAKVTYPSSSIFRILAPKVRPFIP